MSERGCASPCLKKVYFVKICSEVDKGFQLFPVITVTKMINFKATTFYRRLFSHRNMNRGSFRLVLKAHNTAHKDSHSSNFKTVLPLKYLL